MWSGQPTLVGQVASVAGGLVRVRLRIEAPSTLVMIDGESYRIGQIGGFFRIPLGYSNLYAVCTQVGADAAPLMGSPSHPTPDGQDDALPRLHGYGWMSIVLFGEGIGSAFERGVGQYPTVGDEVHIVTNRDLAALYQSVRESTGTITVGQIASASGIRAELNVAHLVSRHCVVVGSTGSGKSNLVTVMLESLGTGAFPNARVVVIDPHGEYSSALQGDARVFRVRQDSAGDSEPLWVPFWALPFDELQKVILGELQPATQAIVRDEVLSLKTAAAKRLTTRPPLEALNADSPIPFSIRQLWYTLDSFERLTFKKAGNQQSDHERCELEERGDPALLKPDRYPAASPYNQPPYKNQRKRNIEKQLEFMVSRIRDGRFSFLLNPGGGFEPTIEGEVGADLDELVKRWIGHDRMVSVFDVSGIPPEMSTSVVGTMLRVIYDTLFWAQKLPIGGRQQPLLVVIDEAHTFLQAGTASAAHRTLGRIAKEGRKYGVGLMLVSQRPSELDSTVLSQCGSVIALRLTNGADRGSVASAVPDDLGGLMDFLPSLRTGEGIFLGEIVPIPTRVRVREARNKAIGDDPRLPDAWQTKVRPNAALYARAVANWRVQSTDTNTQYTDEQGEDTSA